MHQPADVVARCDAIESIYAKARLEAMGLFEELSELVPEALQRFDDGFQELLDDTTSWWRSEAQKEGGEV